MHPSVSRGLFDEEVQEMRAKVGFTRGGWKIVDAAFPDLVVELPHPYGVQRRFRLRCEDWNEQPPSVKSVDADGNELPGEPTENHFVEWGFCVAGTREYHDRHPQDPWASHQDELSLAKIVRRIATYYRKAKP